jgi:hypothetical protein
MMKESTISTMSKVRDSPSSVLRSAAPELPIALITVSALRVLDVSLGHVHAQIGAVRQLRILSYPTAYVSTDGAPSSTPHRVSVPILRL